MGALHDILDKEMSSRFNDFTYLAAGMILTAILVVPDLALSASTLKIAVNGATGAILHCDVYVIQNKESPSGTLIMKLGRDELVVKFSP